MIEIKSDANTGKVSVNLIPLDELVKLCFHLKDNLFPPANKFIQYDTNWIAEFYNSSKVNWLKSKDNKIIAPYEIVHDFRKNPINNWGNYAFKGDFEFPNILSRVKERMVKSFSEDGLLYKGDNPCPRVSKVISSGNNLTFEIQKATYFDQVATNLSLDYKHQKEIGDKIKAETIRQWDIYQSKTKPGDIPDFSKSKLANTIGVGLGITAKNKFGQDVFLIRKRTSSVAVYKNMLHLPFSFSLNFDTNTPHLNHTGTIQELIKPDFRHEQAEELDLEPADIDIKNVKPLLFCRDLCRGGKPQFFFEIEIAIAYEDLVKRIAEREHSKLKREFKTKTTAMTFEDAKKSSSKFSPELLAYLTSKL